MSGAETTCIIYRWSNVASSTVSDAARERVASPRYPGRMRSSIHTAVAGIVGVAIGALGVIVVDYFGSSTGLPVATQSEAGPPCSGLDVPLPVSDLSAVTEGCRTEGVTISFPDGTAVEAGGLGVVVGYDSSETPDKYGSGVLSTNWSYTEDQYDAGYMSLPFDGKKYFINFYNLRVSDGRKTLRSLGSVQSDRMTCYKTVSCKF